MMTRPGGSLPICLPQKCATAFGSASSMTGWADLQAHHGDSGQDCATRASTCVASTRRGLKARWDGSCGITARWWLLMGASALSQVCASERCGLAMLKKVWRHGATRELNFAVRQLLKLNAHSLRFGASWARHCLTTSCFR